MFSLDFLSYCRHTPGYRQGNGNGVSPCVALSRTTDAIKRKKPLHYYFTIILACFAATLTGGAAQANTYNNALAQVHLAKQPDGSTIITIQSKGRGPAVCYLAVDGHRRVFSLEAEPVLVTLDRRYHYTQLSWRCDSPTPCPIWLGGRCATR